MTTSSRRLGWALAFGFSLTAHGAAVVAMMTSPQLQGLTKAPSPSISLEAVHTVVVEALTPTENVEPPAASAAQRESIEAPEPSDQQVAATDPDPTHAAPPEVVEPPAAAEPPRAAAPPPPVSEPTPPSKAAAVAPALVTAEQPDAPEFQVSPEAQLAALEAIRKAEEEKSRAEEQRKQQEEARKKAEAEARDKAEAEARRKVAEEERRKRLEAAERERRQKTEAERRRKQKLEQELAEKKAREAERERKRRAELKAAERRKAKGAEQSRRASIEARGKDSQKSGSGRTSASRGDIMSYAAMVRARVASNRPGGSGQSGTVVVSFGISGGGGITFVRVSRSSGHQGLDSAALSAVRSAGSFPPPPDRGSHSFSIPFHFN